MKFFLFFCFRFARVTIRKDCFVAMTSSALVADADIVDCIDRPYLRY